MLAEDVRLEIENGIATIKIDRGDGRNAVRPQTLSEICDAVDDAACAPEVRAIILTGEGKHFSAGGEFSFLEDLTHTPAPRIRDQIYTAFQGAAKRIWNCPKPTLAAVNGAAVTVGCELSLACDFRIASDKAVFQESWVKLGILPPLGGLYLLPHMVGLGRAAEIALTGRPVPAQEALAIGLVQRVVAADTLGSQAQEWAAELAALPPLAYRAIKEGLHRGMESSMEKEWATNVLAQAMLLGTDDFKEGLASVTERRAGVFNGR